MNKTILLFCLVLVSTLEAFSQDERIKGPVLLEFGDTFIVESPEIETDTTANLKVIFDVSKTSNDSLRINPYIETAARFLNMHTAAGFTPEQLQVAMTIHASAWQDVMTDEAYLETFNRKNPNTELINALTDVGVDIIICGQTAAFRGLQKDDVNPNVKFALSAMTALLQFQEQGYRFIKF